MPERGPEHLGRSNERVKATNNRNNDIGFKDFENEFLGSLNEVEDKSNKVDEQLKELRRDIEKDENNESPNEDHSDGDHDGDGNSNKFKPEAGLQIKALDKKGLEKVKENQITLRDLLDEVVKGLNLPPGREFDLAKEVVAIAGSNLSDGELKENFSQKAISIYKGIEKRSREIEENKEAIQKYVIENLND